MAAKVHLTVVATSQDELIVKAIQELEMCAHRAGLNATARALNNAKNAVGWELAGNHEAAQMAANNDPRAIVA